MLIRKENEMGSINLDKHVIEKIVKMTTKEFPNIICITNSKGQSMNMMKFIDKDMDSHLVEVKKNQGNINIKLNVILKFGTSINTVTNKLINKIKKNVYEVTDIQLKTVTICIKGIKSRKLIKRNIIIKG